jgi:hypothetical protein
VPLRYPPVRSWGSVKQAKRPKIKTRPRSNFVFTELRDGTQRANIAAVGAGLDNARGTIDDRV